MMASEWGEGTEGDGFVVLAPEGASWEVGRHWNMGYLKLRLRRGLPSIIWSRSEG